MNKDKNVLSTKIDIYIDVGRFYLQITFMKNIIVTGASKGIGYATAISLSNNGHRVIAVARSTKLLEQLRTKVGSDLIVPVTADLATSAGREVLISTIKSLNGIDGLINNAAVLINKPFKELSADDWKHQFEVNFFGVIELIKSLLPFINSEAHIVNIGSMAGFQGAQKFSTLSAYGAGKAALANLTEYLAIELSDDKIRVNCLALGAVSTDMLQTAFPSFISEVTAELMGEYIANFTTHNGKLFNGKVIPVALNNPT